MKDWLGYAKDWVVSTVISALFIARSTVAGALDTVFEYTVPRLFRVLLIIAAVSFLAGAFYAGSVSAGASTEAEVAAAATAWRLEGDGGSCSAVAIKPGVAVSALHCARLVESGKLTRNFSSKGYKTTGIVAHRDGKDSILIRVPGLPCPCATFSDAPPVRGDETYLVGYPRGDMLVVLVGQAQELYYYVPEDGSAPETYWVVTPAAIPGMSGGGAFVLRKVVGADGISTWRALLFGVTSRGGDAIALVSTFDREPTRNK